LRIGFNFVFIDFFFEFLSRYIKEATRGCAFNVITKVSYALMLYGLTILEFLGEIVGGREKLSI
jgi:hypothetical protein